MHKFIEKPANKSSIGSRKLVYGFGVNDSDYITYKVIDGKQQRCPYYAKWANMLERCYSTRCQERQPTYIGCTTCEEWKCFSAFKKWMIKQEWEGMQLDKDIKFKGNKIYSPTTCLFIPHALNSLLNDNAAMRGLYPKGVSFNKSRNKLIAHIRYNGKKVHVGSFGTPEKAAAAYQSARTEKIQKLIDGDVYPMATPYLYQHIGN